MKRWSGIVGLLLGVLLIGIIPPTVRAQTQALPELHPQKIVLDPAVPLEQGDLLTLRVDLVNTGKSDAGPFTIDYAWRRLSAASGGWTTFASEQLAGLRVLDQEVTRQVTLDTQQLPPLEAPQGFELRVMVDSQGQVAEQDESNNALRTAFTLLPTLTLGKPDLRPLNLNFDPVSPVSVTSLRQDGTAGDTISISSVVENGGDGDAPPFNVQISYCPVPLAQPGQLCPQALTPLATTVENQDSRAFGGLAAQGTLAFKAELRFRDGNRLLLPAGTYQFQAEVDPVSEQRPFGEVSEQDEANNVLIGFLTLRGPELRPKRIALSTSPVRLGDSVNVIAAVANDGSSSVAGGYKVTFFINGIPFDTVEGPAIDPGSEGTVSASLNTGEFNLSAERVQTLRVVVDSDNRVFEPDETNNVLETSLTLLPALPKLPELHPKDIVLTPPSPIEKGRDLRLVVGSSIVNSGSSPALDFAVTFSYRSQGARRWQPLECVIPPSGCRQLSLGRSQEVRAQGELSVDQLEAGATYEIRVLVDPLDQVAELDEDNNALATTVTVRVPARPDLMISELTFDPPLLSLRPGQQVLVSAQVGNVGEVDVGEAFDVVCQLTNLQTFTSTTFGRDTLDGLAVDEFQTVTCRLDTTELKPGTYQIAILVDPDERVREETRRDNNVLATQVDPQGGGNVLIIQGPDLQVNLLPETASFQEVLQGQSLGPLRLTVQNLGEDNAPSFQVSFPLTCTEQVAFGQQPTSRDFTGLIEPIRLPGLGRGDQWTIEIGLTPQQSALLPVGPCELNAQVDSEQVVAESNEFNNVLPLSIQLQVSPPLANLRFGDLKLSAAEPVRQGQSLELQATVVNAGGRPSGPFNLIVSLCLSRTAEGLNLRCELADDFRQLRLEAVDSLEPGSSRALSVPLSTTDLPPGSYVFQAQLDPDNRVLEQDEEDNVVQVEQRILPPASNLRIQSLAVSPTDPVRQGTPFQLQIVVENSGGDQSGRFNVVVSTCLRQDAAGFVARCDRTEDFVQTLLDVVDNVEPGAVSQRDLTLETGSLTPGTYVVQVALDPDNRVLEQDEEDNVVQVEQRILPAPANLHPHDVEFTPPMPVRQDQPLQISVTVDNKGNDDSGPFTVRFSLCPIDSPSIVSQCRFPQDLEDFRQIALQTPTNLAPGQSTKVSTGIMPPFSLSPGSYAVLVEVDPENRVEESDETDNALVTLPPIQILPPPPNLRPVEVQFDPAGEVQRGQFLLVTARVANTGGTTSLPFLVRFSQCRFDPNPPQAHFCSQPGDFTLFGEATLNGVLAAADSSVTVGFDTHPLDPGSYLIRVEVDAQAEVPESDETDNVLVTQPPLIVLGEGQGSGGGQDGQGGGPSGQSEADLTVLNLSLNKSLVIRGQTLKVEFDLHNQGIQDAGPFTVKMYLQAVGNQKTEIDKFRLGGLVADERRPLRTTLKTNNLSPGYYKVIVVVDVFNEVQESFEANNRQEKQFELR